MTTNEDKPTIDEVRKAWRRSLIDAPIASPTVIARVVRESNESTPFPSVWDIMFGVTVSAALSIVAALPLTRYVGTDTKDLSGYLMYDQIGEAFNNG